MLNVFIFLLCTVHCLKELHYYIPIVFSSFNRLSYFNDFGEIFCAVK